MTKLKYFLFALPVVAAGGALWVGAGTKTAAAEPPAATITRTIIAPGHVEPYRDPVKLAFEAQGRIVAIDVDEGDRVRAGDPIAHLDDRMARARVASAQANLAAATARHALAVRGPRTEDVAAARADADAAQAAASHSATERTRSEALGKSGAISSSVVDGDDAAARVASAQASAAAARYQSLARGTRSEQIAESAAALDAAKADLDAAKVALDQTVLRAPNDGVILRRTAEVGQLVTLTTPMPVVTIADLGKLEVRTELDEADVARVTLGQAAYITADAFGDRHFPVKITRITHELGRRQVRDDDPRAKIDTRVLEVIATFDGTPNVELPLGLRTSVHF